MNPLCLIGLCASLCVNGHPAPRHPATYGGLPPLHGYQRDHVIPLGLGGVDDRSNIRYQRLTEALYKDDEERALEKSLCIGKLTLKEVLDQLAHDWPIDDEHGYDR